jgi:uncharacterized protein
VLFLRPVVSHDNNAGETYYGKARGKGNPSYKGHRGVENEACRGQEVTTKRCRGFAAMDPEQQREIARLGGLASHAKGTAHKFTREEVRHAGKIGGWVISRDRQHIARIGRKGRNALARREKAEEEKGKK